VPLFSSELNHILPPIVVTIALHIDKPSPMPCVVGPLGRLILAKRSKIFFCSSMGIPKPLSLIQKVIVWPLMPAVMSIFPSGVNFIAFEMRLINT